MKILKRICIVLWFLIDPKDCLLETTTKEERDKMGVVID